MTREAIKSDSTLIARLHSETLSSSFLASLGQGFLNCLYIFLIKNEKVWVYEENQQIKGFVSFSRNSAGMMKRFVFTCPISVLFLLGKFFKNPKILKRTFETFLAPFKSKRTFINSGSQVSVPSAELLSISVSPDCQSSGIGLELLDSLEHYLVEHHILEYKVIAGEKLISANKFYLKNDFILLTKLNVHENMSSNVYIKKLNGK